MTSPGELGQRRWKLVPYFTKSGRAPIDEFLEDIEATEPEAYVTFAETVRPAIEEFGPAVGEPYFKRIGIGLPDFGEIRWRVGRRQFRIYVSIESGRRLACYLGLPKKWQRMRRSDIALCTQRYNDYHSDGYSGAQRARLRRA